MSLFGKKETGEFETGGESKGRSKSGRLSYGIAEAMLLMRTLPVDQNVELVVRVVRNTLESMNVQLGDIIEDARQREEALSGRMKVLDGEIAEFSAQIEQRRQEIARLQQDLTEVTTVKDRLFLAEKLEKKPASPAASLDRSPTPVPPPLRTSQRQAALSAAR